MLPGCYARITRARASLRTGGRVYTDNEAQGKLVGHLNHIKHQGTENTQVLEHNSILWGRGGGIGGGVRDNLIIAP